MTTQTLLHEKAPLSDSGEKLYPVVVDPQWFISRWLVKGSLLLEAPEVTVPRGDWVRRRRPRKLASDGRHHAVDVIIETVLAEEPGTVTLVPTAPLTNIAMAVRKEPRIVDRVAEVVPMGGAVAGGNWSAAAEFNIVTDPEAAHIVFGERWPVTMVGLDLTHQALATPDVVARIAALGTGPARFVVQVLDFFGASYRAEQGFPHPPVHDPCAVARVIDAAVMTTRRAPVTVELSGRYTRGMTVADVRMPDQPDCRTQVAVELDRARFWDLVVDALERIGEP